MWAEYLSAGPAAVEPGQFRAEAASMSRCKRIHRVLGLIFTVTVAANFLAMPWAPPRPWITYAQLPPLLVLMSTCLFMLAISPTRTGATKPGGAR
jgi:hypothetical protein